ncbi:MAG: winged helix-turn-helix transcriptional regulator [Clostridia bacterium]|nr:winged helix-turn-helix transcriptional regulator [Clostridia bacterium]
MIGEVPSCEHEHVHSEAVERARNGMPDIDLLYDLAELFKVFGDSTRVRILYLLLENEMCVCDMADALDMTISAISHQLRVLKSANLVRFRKEGKAVFYSLADEHVRSILDQGMEHVEE